jgi:aspartyl-tRNA(Asn)/glutamyl-tRNA(Gln) amidotransferase subunit A
MYEAAATYGGVPRDEMTPTFRRRLEIGDRIERAAYLGALRSRRGLVRSVCNDIARVDAVVVPGAVSRAPRLDDMEAPVAGMAVNWPDVSARTMALWNVTGLPSVAVPSGCDDAGLPVGIQIVGAPHTDERCLTVAAAFQAATAHHLSSPFDPLTARSLR